MDLLATHVGLWTAAKRRHATFSVAHAALRLRVLPAALPGSLFARHKPTASPGGP